MKENTSDQKSKLKFCAAISLVSGLIAHSFVIFNKISIYDDAVSTFALGAPLGQGTFTSGRWFLGILGELIKRLYGANISLPILNGLLSVCFIGVAASIIVLLFNVTKKSHIALIIAIMETYPVVASTFAYMFAAPYYCFALALSAAGAACIVLSVFTDGSADIKKQIAYAAAGVVCITCGLGIYQAYYTVSCTVVVMYLIISSINNKKINNSSLTRKAVLCALFLLISIVLYLALNKLCLHVKGLEMTSYQGLNSMYDLSISNIFKGVGEAFNIFFWLSILPYRGIFSQTIVNTIILFLYIVSFIIIIFSIRKNKLSVSRIFIVAIFILLFPVSVNLIYVFSYHWGSIHTLMVYGTSAIFILPVLLFDKVPESEKKYSPEKIANTIVCISLAFVISEFVFLDNAAYFKSYTFQQHATSYYERLISKMESTDGYEPGMQTVFVGNFDLDSYPGYPELDFVMIHPYDSEEMIATGSYSKYFMYRYCGYDVNIPEKNDTETTKIINSKEVKEMPSYPDNGSIKVIDHRMIIKAGKQ